jgi:hypothetical protein
MTRPSLVAATIGLFAATAATAAPYSMLEAFRDAASRINSTTSLRYTSVAVMVSSTDPAVAPTDIVMTVHGDEESTIRVGPGGLLAMASNPTLAAANPEVTLNQPRGTVNIRLQPFVRVSAREAVTLDVVGKMRLEYAQVRARSPLLERTYRVQPTAIRLVPARAGGPLTATTSCGVTFSAAGGGAVQAPLADYPVGCYLTVAGNADRLELVFDR